MLDMYDVIFFRLTTIRLQGSHDSTVLAPIKPTLLRSAIELRRHKAVIAGFMAIETPRRLALQVGDEGLKRSSSQRANARCASISPWCSAPRCTSGWRVANASTRDDRKRPIPDAKAWVYRLDPYAIGWTKMISGH